MKKILIFLLLFNSVIFNAKAELAYIDINFIIMPTVHKQDFYFGIYDLITMLSFALIFIGGFKYITSRSNLVPLNDTELIHSINHRNH